MLTKKRFRNYTNCMNKNQLPNNTNNGSRNLGRLIMQLRRLERKPHHFGNAGPLTPSKIHTVEAIRTEGAVLISELAMRLGITKIYDSFSFIVSLIISAKISVVLYASSSVFSTPPISNKTEFF